MSGTLSVFAGALLFVLFTSTMLENNIAGGVALVSLIVIFTTVFRHGIGGAFAEAGAVAFAVAFAFAGAVAFAVALAGAGVVTLAGAGAFAVALAGALAGAGAFTVAFTVARAFTVAGAFASTLLGLYLGWRSLKGDPRDPWIRQWVVAFAASGGTSFFKLT